MSKKAGTSRSATVTAKNGERKALEAKMDQIDVALQEHEGTDEDIRSCSYFGIITSEKMTFESV